MVGVGKRKNFTKLRRIKHNERKERGNEGSHFPGGGRGSCADPTLLFPPPSHKNLPSPKS